MLSDPIYNEPELLHRIAAGDESAYRAVFDKHWNRVYQVALGFLKSPPAAQDAVQGIFLQLWEKRKHLTSVRNFDNYLFIMSRNFILNSLRKISASWEQGELAEAVQEDYLTPENYLAVRETRTLIKQAVDSLPPQQQCIFKLSREEGLSHLQIAERLSIAPATVKSHIIRALNNIRSFLLYHSDGVFLAAWFLMAVR